VTETKARAAPLGGEQSAAMDDYAREMMELKTLVTRTLEKKGVLAKIRVSLSPSHFSSFPGPDFLFHPFHRDRGQYRAVAAPWIQLTLASALGIWTFVSAISVTNLQITL
jgi:hypothetical protein